MARIAGVNVPTNKRVHIALTYVHGIGLTGTKSICKKVGITEDKRINNLSEDELTKIRDIIDADYLVEEIQFGASGAVHTKVIVPVHF